MWTGPDKEAPLLPKSAGDGRMLSGMQSQDFGFGLPMTTEQLAQVNISMGLINNTLTQLPQWKFIGF